LYLRFGCGNFVDFEENISYEYILIEKKVEQLNCVHNQLYTSFNFVHNLILYADYN